ncbi:aldehyde dehydrogenase (NADP(+)) [Georgenia halophila]|uniref:Aldehyde dehydrogenase (NADP(+)) n=1 Tax=Georgenia halophila TaxID=620889 RepID=A0ABP8LGB4_9MICO
MTTMAAETGPTDLDILVHAAHEAYQGAYGVPPRERAGWLTAIADALDGAADELVDLAQEETHLPEPRLRGELTRTTFQLRLLADEVVAGQPLDATIDHHDPDWGMGPRPDLRRVNVPLGVVGVFGASNFPFAFSVMGGDSASALAAGCAVVHKIHQAHGRLGKRTADIVIDALGETSAPEDLFTAVTGQEAAEALVDHPLVKAVGFTGSTAVGRILRERINARPEPIPFYGELGSTNPVFVTEQAWAARRDQLLADYAGSLTLGMGQFCTKPGVLFVPDLDESATATLSEALAGTPRFPMLSERLAEGYGKAVAAVSATDGVETLIDGADRRDRVDAVAAAEEDDDGDDDDGGVDDEPSPTVLVTTAEEVRSRPEILGEEMFGPAGLVIRYGSESQLAAVAELLEGQLTATVHGEPGEHPAELLSVLETRAGRVIWNGWPTGVTVSYAQQHGGPHPATTAPGTTSVGTAAVRRFVRPVSFQSFADEHLPPALQEDNPWGIARRVDGVWHGPHETGGA